MNAREQRGIAIATTMKITNRGNLWIVPSQTGVGKYHVFPKRTVPFCTCKDHEATGEPCKHIYAAMYRMKHKQNPDGSTTVTETVTLVKKTTYSQMWPQYNAAQQNEKAKFVILLNDLCKNIVDDRPRSPKGGKPPVSLADAVFACIFKVYSCLSARRFSSDLREAHDAGYIGCLPHYNSVINYLEDPVLLPILQQLITQSVLPLKAIEQDFAVDSTGFATNHTFNWLDEKHGVNRPTKDWVKVHALTGVKTNAVFAVEIDGRDSPDSPHFKPLVNATAKDFHIREVSGDAAYPSQDNFGIVDKHGGTAYLCFKANTTGSIGGLFQKMFHYFGLKKEEYLAHYHKRSNIESTFSAVKRKFGDLIRNRGAVSMKNEMLAKLVAYNIVCVIHEMYELGIVPDGWPTEAIGQPAKPLALPAPEVFGQVENEPAQKPQDLPFNFCLETGM